METAYKLKLLKASAAHDVCSSSNPRSEMSVIRTGLSQLGGIYRSSTPNGCSNLFKVLLSNKCMHNCAYCMNRCNADIERSSLLPEELASTFIQLHKARQVEGLFLSSAVDGSPEKAMHNMIKAVELLRFRHHYKGFIHLKVLPGVSDATIQHACSLADRASINIEAPTSERLQKIASSKDYTRDILRTIQTIRAEEKKGRLRSGQTTQFIVGAAGETDKEIIDTSADLYRDALLRRIYFSAFVPLEGTPLENSRRTAPLREHRLYQCDFLMREYAFNKEDFIFEEGKLPLDIDPKMNYALNCPELFPVEVNSAPPQLLLKVPGIGPTSCQRLVKERKYRRFSDIKSLQQLGVVGRRAAPFLLLNGKRAITESKKKILARQLQLNFSVH
jgi:putative DNA modification/repair radical SAM protein